MKYPIILQQMFNIQKKSGGSVQAINHAKDTMKSIAEDINEVQRVHEEQIYVNFLQMRLRNWKDCNFLDYGRLLLEDDFNILIVEQETDETTAAIINSPAVDKSKRRLLLFEKALFVCKIRTDLGKEGEGFEYMLGSGRNGPQFPIEVRYKIQVCFQM